MLTITYLHIFTTLMAIYDQKLFLSKNVFQLSSEICVNLFKMKNKDFYKLLINKDKIELKASIKWARDK